MFGSQSTHFHERKGVKSNKKAIWALKKNDNKVCSFEFDIVSIPVISGTLALPLMSSLENCEALQEFIVIALFNANLKNASVLQADLINKWALTGVSTVPLVCWASA